MRKYIELVKVSFDAIHTKGILEGMTTSDTMTFGSMSDAYDWANRVNENNRNGDCKFWVDNVKQVGVKLLERV